MSDPIGFTANLAGIDRQALLAEAAAQLDASLGHLGTGQQSAASDAGAFTRGLAADAARLPAYPDVYRITEKDFIARGKPAPVAISELASKFNFYWVAFPIGLQPQQHWGFHMLEVRVEFGIGAPPHLRPKAFRILPEKRFAQALRANMSLAFTLNENLDFEVDAGRLEASHGDAKARAGARAGGKLEAGAGAVFGPFEYSVKKAKIDHSAPGLEWVFWRLDGAEFFQEDTPALITILQVPKALTRCEVRGELQASRYFSFGTAPWQKAIAQLGPGLRRFFDEGMPLRHEMPWDITPSL